jgi:hypothetical protein
MQEAEEVLTVPQMEHALAEIQDLFSSADGQKQYIEWFSHPVTKKMLMAARVMAKPKQLTPGVSADYLLGESCGAHGILDFFIRPQNFVRRPPVNLPKPNYGADRILQEEK